MKYNELIEKLMPLVSEASANPCVVWRSGSGQWSLDLMDAADNKAREHLREVRKTDPCAVVVTGEQFSRGSYPFVFDKVMVERLYAEYAATHANNATMSERLAIVNFIEDNFGEFSPEAAEYIAEQATSIATPTTVKHWKRICPFWHLRVSRRKKCRTKSRKSLKNSPLI